MTETETMSSFSVNMNDFVFRDCPKYLVLDTLNIFGPSDYESRNETAYKAHILNIHALNGDTTHCVGVAIEGMDIRYMTHGPYNIIITIALD